jgi:LysM repeat protein
MTGKRQFFTIIIFLFISLYSFASAMPDSVGVKTIDGKKYTVHRVAAKEGWYGIARTYNVSLNDLHQANPRSGDALKIGEEILIPSAAATQPAPAKPGAQTPTVIKEPIYYEVKKKETLYHLAKTYNTTPDSLKKWNNISVKKVKSGQKLIVGYTVKIIEPPKQDTVAEKIKTVTPASPKKVPVKTEKKKPDPPKIKRPVSEQGVASWIGDNDETSKIYYALHRTAPVGTIIKVTNKMNKKYIFVKVLGTLPDTGDNYDLIIKISKSSAEKLGARDKRFHCELDYSVVE